MKQQTTSPIRHSIHDKSAKAKPLSNRWALALAPVILGATLGVLLLLLLSPTQKLQADGLAFTETRLFGTDSDPTTKIDVGDMDSDGDLDIVTGNQHEQSAIYFNDNDGEFNTSVTFGPSSAVIVGLALGDMDGDGDLDIVTSYVGYQQDTVYFNDGRGQFDTFINFGSITNTIYDEVILGDVNNDGSLDIITKGKVYLNDSNGQFGSGSVFDSPDGNPSTALGDVNGDGYLDIIRYIDMRPKIYLNDGNGVFQLAFTLGLHTTTDIVIGDMDQDGDLEIVLGTIHKGIVYWNTGNGQFTNFTEFGNANDQISVLALGDMDGDGDLDIISGVPNHLIFLNDGNGQFTSATNFGTGLESVGYVEIGDIDGDGNLDIILGAPGEQKMVYLNNGAERFNAKVIYSAGSSAIHKLAVGDMDADGDLDFVAGRESLPSVVYFNNSAGKFTSSTPFGTNNVGYIDLAIGDINGDGYLDIVAGIADRQDTVYVNNGNGQFNNNIDFGPNPSSTRLITIGDMDGDNDLDIITNNLEQIVVYLNDGVGQFNNSVSFETGLGTQSMAIGDMDGDSDLDIVVGHLEEQNVVYFNDGTAHFNVSTNFDIGSQTFSLAIGDMDGDGDLDIVTGNYLRQSQVYLNNGAGQFDTHVNYGTIWSPAFFTTIGDIDGDADLDIIRSLVQANGMRAKVVYLNNGSAHFDTSINFGIEGSEPTDIAVGDMDGDGDLDVIEANVEQNVLYFNQLIGGNSLVVTRPSPPSNANYYSTPFILDTPVITIPFTTFQPDGEPIGQVEAEYSLNGGGNWQPAIPASSTFTQTLRGNTLTFDGIDDWVNVPNFILSNDFTLSLWVNPDAHTDGQLLTIYSATGHFGLGIVEDGYEVNLHGNTYSGGGQTSDWQYLTVVGQGNGDGTTTITLYRDRQPLWQHVFNTVVGNLWGQLAFGIGSAGFFQGQMGEVRLWNSAHTQAQIQAERQVQLAGNEPDLIAYWPTNEGSGQTLLDKGPNHYTAILGGGSPIYEPAWVAGGVFADHVFYWDVFASGVFGKSDNVVLRFTAYPQPFPTGIIGTYQYTNSVPGPFLYPSYNSTTFPFRVRGTQVRVVDETGQPISGANVYRLPAGATLASVISSPTSGVPYHTDGQGYLQGFGRLENGDELVALYRITATQHYTVYHTSAPPTEAGVGSFTVGSSGVQTLTVSSENVLILFNLIVSLEWDARNDPTFMAQLQNDLRRTSQILFDVTDGQAALGDIRIYHDRGYWGHADVIIRASNTVRPAASLGGIVTVPMTYTVSATEVITNAYLPGQVVMPPQWNRYGNPSGTIGEDWPLTLAHELGHYAFFVPDNYLGLTPEGHLTIVDCAGSIMSDPYQQTYTEFLAEHDWNGACLRTLAELFTGRADWDRILEAYSDLHAPVNPADELHGPNSLPLAVTQMEVLAPITPTTTLLDPFFTLADENGQPVSLSGGQTEVYLTKTDGNLDPSDDYVIALGTPIGNIVQARGVSPGDRLCVFDHSQATMRIGCIDEVGSYPEPISLVPTPDWNPSLFVSAITTNTLTITVTHMVNEPTLMVQVLPALGTASSEIAMISYNGTTFTQTVTAPDGAYYGFIRIWSPTNPEKEMMFEYATVDWGGKALAWGNLLNPWGGKALAWGGKALAWGGKALAWGGKALAWGAPVMSTDGQVSIFPRDNIFGENPQDITLQKLATPPDLSSWLVPVGQAYRVKVNGSIPNSDILFRYLASDVPSGYEYVENVAVYYSPDEGATWLKLSTFLATDINHASAPVMGEGIYTLAATIAVVPRLVQGWNNFSYTVHEPRTVANALASIESYYTAVANYDQNRPDAWQTYYVAVTVPFSPVINTLDHLEYQRSYLLYATEPITLYLRPDNFGGMNSLNGLQEPPTTFYGWITPTVEFSATVGTAVTAWVNGNLCGQTTVAAFPNNQLYYAVQVSALDINGGNNNCGHQGDNVIFKVGDVQMDHNPLWDNHLAWFHPMTATADILPPILTVPQTIITEATSLSGALVSYVVTAIDNRDPNPMIECSPTSGDIFSLGVTIVICTATDTSGNSTVNSFEVHVVDTTSPELVVPNDMFVEATSPTGAIANYSTTATDIVDPNPTVYCNPTSGNQFPIGTTLVSCTAIDFSNNSITRTFTITIEDTTPPILVVPTDMVVEAMSPNGTPVVYSTIAIDIVDPNPTTNCDLASGSTFSLGVTLVTCVASDFSANSITKTFHITVRDTTPPMLVVPTDITVEVAGYGGSVVTYNTFAIDFVDLNPIVNCNPSSGNVFPLGVTTVICRAWDFSNNIVTETFTIIVEDTVPPTLILPTNIVTETTQSNGVVIIYSVTAIDTGDHVPTVVCIPASGATFPIGTTSVSCTASDNSGNQSLPGTFTVTVNLIHRVFLPFLTSPQAGALSGSPSKIVPTFKILNRDKLRWVAVNSTWLQISSVEPELLPLALEQSFELVPEGMLAFLQVGGLHAEHDATMERGIIGARHLPGSKARGIGVQNCFSIFDPEDQFSGLGYIVEREVENGHLALCSFQFPFFRIITTSFGIPPPDSRSICD